MLTSDARDDIVASADRVLREEARRNETTVAHLRAGACFFLAAAFWAIALRPDLAGATTPVPPERAVIVTVWLAFSLVLVVALRRRWFHAWLAPGVAVVDAAAIALNHIFNSSNFPPPIHPLHTTRALALACALLAMSGGLRLDRRVAYWITALAVAAFLLGSRLTVPTEPPLYSLFTAALVLVAGVFGVWATSSVRRAAMSEAGRHTLARFLPRSVIHGALEDPAALLAEPRQLDATVLVSDLRGFTRLAEPMTPAAVLAFLNTVQGELARVVERHAGTVDKFLGDGMLAVFGAPDPTADHAARALAAARDIQRSLARLNTERTARGEPAIRAGIALHSGHVVAGCLGSAARLEFTVIGDTVNTASRLESLTKERDVDVLASADTVRRAGAAADPVTPLGTVTLRGRAEPLEIFAVLPRPD